MGFENSVVSPGDLEGKKLIIIPERTDKEAAKEFGEEFAKLVAGEEVPVVYELLDENFRKLMTEKRRELIRYLLEEQPESISEAAEELQRGIKEVHQDLSMLEDFGIIYFEENGRAKKPATPFSEIELRMKFGGEELDGKSGLKA